MMPHVHISIFSHSMYTWSVKVSELKQNFCQIFFINVFECRSYTSAVVAAKIRSLDDNEIYFTDMVWLSLMSMCMHDCCPGGKCQLNKEWGAQQTDDRQPVQWLSLGCRLYWLKLDQLSDLKACHYFSTSQYHFHICECEYKLFTPLSSERCSRMYSKH